MLQVDHLSLQLVDLDGREDHTAEGVRGGFGAVVWEGELRRP